MALLWKMICNLGDPMSLRHPVWRFSSDHTSHGIVMLVLSRSLVWWWRSCMIMYCHDHSCCHNLITKRNNNTDCHHHNDMMMYRHHHCGYNILSRSLVWWSRSWICKMSQSLLYWCSVILIVTVLSRSWSCIVTITLVATICHDHSSCHDLMTKKMSIQW